VTETRVAECFHANAGNGQPGLASRTAEPPSAVARHGLSVFGIICLATLLTPLGLLLLRSSGIGKRTHCRRRVLTSTLCLLLAVLMVVSPQQLYAMQAQATPQTRRQKFHMELTCFQNRP
jgi:hypothetical protein